MRERKIPIRQQKRLRQRPQQNRIEAEDAPPSSENSRKLQESRAPQASTDGLHENFGDEQKGRRWMRRGKEAGVSTENTTPREPSL